MRELLRLRARGNNEKVAPQEVAETLVYLKALLATVIVVLLWANFVGFGAVSGWWSRPVASAEDARLLMDAATETALDN